MFGIYRTLLAFIVVLHHLCSIPVIGHFAVHGFFILSGYLMTLIMNESYGYSINGFLAFFKNRLLRLYPIYWFILLLSLLIIFYYGEAFSQSYRRFIYIPNDLLGWIANFSLVYFDFFPNKIEPRISPPTWALTVELFFYLLIGLGISKTRHFSVIWFGCSFLYMFATHYFDGSYSSRYSSLIAGTLPFSLGALIYHFQDKFLFLKKSSCHQLLFAVIAITIFNTYVGAVVVYESHPSFFFYITFYLNYILNSLVILLLINVNSSSKMKSIDAEIGRFSYPMYLFHWQAGFLSSMLLWSEPILGASYKGFVSMLFSLCLCVVVSLLSIKIIENPLEKYRRNIRNLAQTSY